MVYPINGSLDADGTTLQRTGKTLSIKPGGVGPTELAAQAVTLPKMERRTSGHIVIGQGAAADVTAAAVSGDITLSATGVAAIATFGKIAYAATTLTAAQVQALLDDATKKGVLLEPGVHTWTAKVTVPAGKSLWSWGPDFTTVNTNVAGDGIDTAAEPDNARIHGFKLNCTHAANTGVGITLGASGSNIRRIRVYDLEIVNFLVALRWNTPLNGQVRGIYCVGRGLAVAGGLGVDVGDAVNGGNAPLLEDVYVTAFEVGIRHYSQSIRGQQWVLESCGTGCKWFGNGTVDGVWTGSGASDNTLDFDIQSPCSIYGFGSQNVTITFLNATVQSRSVIIPERLDGLAARLGSILIATSGAGVAAGELDSTGGDLYVHDGVARRKVQDAADKGANNGIASLSATQEVVERARNVSQGAALTVGGEIAMLANELLYHDGVASRTVEKTSRKGVASGYASLSAGTKVVEDPANAQTAAAASKIPISGAGGKLDSAWLPDAAAATRGAVLQAASDADLGAQTSSGDAGGAATVSAAADVATKASVDTALANIVADINDLKAKLRTAGVLAV